MSLSPSPKSELEFLQEAVSESALRQSQFVHYLLSFLNLFVDHCGWHHRPPVDHSREYGDLALIGCGIAVIGILWGGSSLHFGVSHQSIVQPIGA